jgi:GNAT superfamily N-acetyltransferase
MLTDLAIRSKRSWGYDDAFMRRVMDDMIVHPEYLMRERGIVAQVGDAIAGYAIVRMDEEEAFVRDLFVDPAYFGQGVGRRLFDACVAFARNNHARRLRLEGDPNAQSFYEHLGMRLTGRVPSNAAVGRTLPVMTLDLPVR